MANEPLIDRQAYGRLLRAARIVAGYDRVEDAVQHVHQDTGLHLSPRTWYALERGEQGVTLEQHLAILLGLRPPSGPEFFRAALSPLLRETWPRSHQPEHP